MNSLQRERMKELLVAAAALPVAERAGYLDGACGGDAEVRMEVESLLAAEELPTAPLSGTAGVLGAAGPATGGRIGGFAIRRIIGEGGMGVVYEAEQEEQGRVVAVKVMRVGLASLAGQRRFREEWQSLAKLEHPGIARMYEAGVHEAGGERVPYFAMEYIAGARPITEHVREKRLSTEQTLDLFASVCDAVGHGHTKLIIHRDLKPRNILVGSDGVAKVIDFGVAKSVAADERAETMLTGVGQLIGTLQYMSPEQLEGGPRDVDVRSDVYALGVVLYEMLTGRRPYEVGSGSVPQEMRAIVERSPTRPSAVNPRLRGDVETIVLKALERERGRRYQSVAELAADVRSCLASRPISARRASMWYRVRMLERRRRGAFWGIVVGATSLAVLVAGAVVLVEVLRQRAIRERNRATFVAARMVEFLESQNPKAGLATVPFLEAVEKLATSVDRGDVAEHADLAVPLYRAIAGVLDAEGQNARARALAERALELAKTRYGAVDMEVVASLRVLAYVKIVSREYLGAERDLREGISMSRQLYPNGHMELAKSLGALAGLDMHFGRYDEAVDHTGEQLSIIDRLHRNDRLSLSSALHQHAHALERSERSSEAKRHYYRSYEMNKELVPGDNRDTVRDLHALAWVHTDLGEREQANRFGEEYVAMLRRMANGDGTELAHGLNMRAGMHRDLNEPEAAERRFAESLEMYQRLMEGDHEGIALGLDDLATARQKLGRLEEAEAMHRRSVEMWRRLHKGDYHLTAVAMSNRARCLAAMGRRGEALEQGKAAATMAGRILPSGNKVRKRIEAVLAELER